MNKQLELQLDFQTLAGQKSFHIEEIPDIETRKLRLRLALEELTELAGSFGLDRYFIELKLENINLFDDAVNKKIIDTHIYNQTETLDALIDIAVINNGTIITCGFEQIFDREYENVDTNNKTKFHIDYLEALKTQKHYTELNIQTEIKEVEVCRLGIDNLKYYTVINNSGKVLKPYNYQSVKLNLNN